MTALRRFLAFVLGILGVIGTIACIAGIVGVWFVKQPLLDRATHAFDVSDRALRVVSEWGDVIQDTLANSQKDLNTIKSKAAVANNAANKPSLTDLVFSRMVADQLGAKVKNAGYTLTAVSDASIVLNSVLGQVNQLPGLSVNALIDDQLQGIQGTLSEVTNASKKLSSLLDDSRPDEEPAPGTAAATVEIEALLKRIIERVEAVRARGAIVQKEVTELQPRLVKWIGAGTVIATIILAWIGLSQMVMVGVAWRWLRAPSN